MAQEHAIVRRPVEGRILFIRGHKVLLDSDLAELYGVGVKRLNEQVKRNPDRFPADFMFLLTAEEYTALRSQIATSKPGRGGRRYASFAFTEHGAIMAASVLNSPRAIEMSVLVVRAFVRLREMLATNKELAAKVAELERRLETHNGAIKHIVAAIKQLMQPPIRPPRQIGFRPEPAASKAKASKQRVRISARAATDRS
jgi:phage regulator Rha-like protein